MPEVSVVIRTRNEEAFIGHCLKMVFQQEFKDFEVIVVDNESNDQTIGIVKRYPVSKIVTIKYFQPGLAGSDHPNERQILLKDDHNV